MDYLLAKTCMPYLGLSLSEGPSQDGKCFSCYHKQKHSVFLFVVVNIVYKCLSRRNPPLESLMHCCVMLLLSNTGKNPTDEYLEAMMTEAPGPINFTMFLTMFGEKLNGTDPEDVIRNAFACFDEEGTGECFGISHTVNFPCKYLCG